MAEKLNLNRFKSSGVYTVEIDESTNLSLPISTGRLIIGSSKKGPINSVVAVNDLRTRLAVYGEIDTKLEKNGSFFHRTMDVALREGPVFALNLVPVSDTDKAYFGTFNTESASTNSTWLESMFTSKISDFYNTQKLWFASIDQLNKTKNIELGDLYVNSSSSYGNLDKDANKILSFVNLGKKEVTVWTRVAAVTGYDLTVAEYYKLLGSNIEIPEYLHVDDIVSDFFVEAITVEGDWTDYLKLSNDPVYGQYFTERGLIIAKLNDFVSLREVTLLNKAIGCIIPDFRDLTNSNVSIDRIFNRNFAQTSIFCSLDFDKVDIMDLSEDEFDTASGNENIRTHRLDLVGHGFDENEYWLDPNATVKTPLIDVLSHRKAADSNFQFTIQNPAAALGNVVAGESHIITAATSYVAAYENGEIWNAWKKGIIKTGDRSSSLSGSFYIKIDGLVKSSLTVKYVEVLFYSDATLTNQTSPETVIVGANDLVNITSTGDKFKNSFNLVDTTYFNGAYQYFAPNRVTFTLSPNLYGNTAKGEPANGSYDPAKRNEVDEFFKVGHYVKAGVSAGRPRLLKITSVVSQKILMPILPTTTTTFNVTNSGYGNYVINGQSNPTLNLIEGQTYTFIINAPGHPFWIKTNISLGIADAYTTGVTNNGTDNGTITFVVPIGAPTLYYNCQYHNSMAGTVNTLDSSTVPSSVGSATTLKYTVTVSAPASATTLGLDLANNLIHVYKGIKNFSNHVVGIKLPGLDWAENDLYPNGTAARQDDILDFMYEYNLASTLADNETLDYRYIIDSYAGQVSSSAKSALVQLAADHGKALAILNNPSFAQLERSTDPSFVDVVTKLVSAEYIATGGDLTQNPSFQAGFAAGEKNGIPLQSYAAYFMPNLIVQENGRNKSVPPAAYVSNVFMKKYRSGNTFSIAAGKRGVITDPEVVGIEYDLTNEDRDFLEPAGHNLIVRRRGFGIMIFSNNTAYQRVRSALNNIHVREALVTIEKDVERILINFLFDFNDEITRLRVKTLVRNYLEAVKDARGISSYSIVFDESNNGPEVLENNAGIIDIIIDFPRGIHKFINRITITRAGGQLSSQSSGFTPSF